MIGVFVAAGLLLLYKATGIFFKGALLVKSICAQVLVLRGELSFYMPLQIVYYTFMAFVSAFIGAELRSFTGRLAFMAGACFLTITLAPLLAYHGWLFEPFSGMAAVLMAGLCGTIYGASEDSRRALEQADWLKGRMTDSQINKFLSAPESSSLGTKRELTVLTCRILNHADLGNQISGDALESAVTDFMHEVAKTVITKGAYLDACNVEGVRAVFGLADSAGEHALEACRAALALQRHLDILAKASQNKIAFGIALATGPMSAGIFGHDHFAQLSVMGEPLDFSRRLCSINHIYGSHVLISARTYQMTKDSVEARPMEMVSAPRMHQISEVYELLAEKGKFTDEQAKARDAFWQGVVSLRKGAYKDAIGHLKRAQLAGLEDAPLKYFLDRAEAAVREDEEEPGGKQTAKHVRVLTAN